MSLVLICDPDMNRSRQNVQALQSHGHQVASSKGLAETLERVQGTSYKLLVLGLEALRPEDEGLWGTVEKLTFHLSVIGLHKQPSEAVCQAAARVRIAAVLPPTAPREVFLYAVEQTLRQNAW
jgi:DNA-binding NtrC family response regulator